MKHVLTIIRKEWSEVFKNRWVIATMTLVPLLFTALPLVVLATTGTGSTGGAEMSGLPGDLSASCPGMTAGECVQVYVLNQFMLLFMIMPLMIPTTIAAYSIVGEKTTRSLEPLLATPIST
ncbi:MAG: ABC transporter permease subunit, partial [Anaerolineaceae bacterium]|nr:ABC transporter permease subunit [Anaerolineaceae bacterium]